MAIISVSGKINSGKDLVGSIIQYLTTYKSYGYTHPTTEKDFNDFTKNNHFNSWKIVKWADKLKDMVCILLGCTRKQLEDRVFKETPLGEEWTSYGYANGFWSHSDGNPSHKMMDSIQCDKETYEEQKRINWQTAYKRELTPRLLMQLLGTECGRNILHHNVWVNATLTNYDYIQRWIDVGSEAVLPNLIITDTRFPNEADAVKSRGGINIRIERDDYIFDGDGKRIIPTKEYVNTSNKQHESETALDNYTFDYVIENNGTIEDLIIKVKEILIKEQII